MLYAEVSKRRQMETNLRVALKLFHRLGYLRGAMTKLGQALGNLPLLLPEQVAETLDQLHSESPPMHFPLIREVLRNEFPEYDALQIQLNRRFANGLTLLTNYTFSKSLDNSSYDLTTGSGSEYQIATRPDLNHALSQFDQTHRFVFAAVYQLPFGKGRQMLNKGGVLNAVLGGWQVSSNFTANTGSPFSVLQGGTNTSNSLAGSLFPNRLSNGALPSGQQTIHEWFNTSAFASPAIYTFGNSGRDILRGPGFWDLDTALMKDFPIPVRFGEQPRLEFRGDFFNFLNHPNFALPSATTGSAAFGTITSASPARIIQLGLQLMF